MTKRKVTDAPMICKDGPPCLQALECADDLPNDRRARQHIARAVIAYATQKYPDTPANVGVRAAHLVREPSAVSKPLGDHGQFRPDSAGLRACSATVYSPSRFLIPSRFPGGISPYMDRRQ